MSMVDKGDVRKTLALGVLVLYFIIILQNSMI